MGTVLIIGESPTTRAVIKVYLVGQRCEFLEAGGAAEGLSLARRQPPDVMVVDLKREGAATFCHAVRGDGRVKQTPIILLAASDDDEWRGEALLAGATHFMSKPIDGATLADKVQTCLERKR